MEESMAKSVLNRSHSSPDIYSQPTSVHRRIFVEEVIRYENLKSPLIRHFSSEEVYNGRDRNLQSFYNDNRMSTPFTPTSFNRSFLDTTSRKRSGHSASGGGQSNYHQQQLQHMSSSFTNENDTLSFTETIKNEDSPMEIDTSDNSFNSFSKKLSDFNTVNDSYYSDTCSIISDTCSIKSDISTITSMLNKNTTNYELHKRSAIRRLAPRENPLKPSKNPLNQNHLTETNLKYLGSVKPSPTCSIICTLKYLFLITCALIALIIYIDNPLIFEDKENQLKNIRDDLKSNVLSQDDPIFLITKSLERFHLWPKKTKILPFVGSSGVGKTHMANIIKKNFYYKLVQEIDKKDLDNEKVQKNFLNSLKSCCLNLLVIDDMTIADLYKFLDFIELVPKDKSILVIPIFSVQHVNDNLEFYINYNDYRIIEVAFDESGLYHEVILFNEINLETVKSWLENTIKNVKGENWNEEKSVVNNILKNHDVKYNGLKGLYSKIFV